MEVKLYKYAGVRSLKTFVFFPGKNFSSYKQLGNIKCIR